jgi:hypothetical protein
MRTMLWYKLVDVDSIEDEEGVRHKTGNRSHDHADQF